MTSSVRELSIREGRELAAEYPVCIIGAECRDQVRRGGCVYNCTREFGHTKGPHVAHVAHVPGASAVATWEPA